jgi:glycosyltransferase involved in cell wall biosynthesis
MRVSVLGRASSLGLEASYGRALAALDCKVGYFDLEAAVVRHTRLSRVGQLFNNFVPVEAWVRKANRELFLHAFDERPDVLIVPGATQVRVGALAQIKVSRPATRLVLLWPDPLVSLERHTLESLPIYDLVVTYSRDSVGAMERLGARRVMWLPFAVDFEVHPSEVEVTAADRARFACDVILIGNHRPERERAILALVEAGIAVKVYGTELWKRDAARPDQVERYWQREVLMGADYVKASRSAELCLNVIDPGNYPAANMRFFENFATGTASLNSPCPELAEEFVDREATAYFDSNESLVSTVRELQGNPDLRRRMGARAKDLVTRAHSYRHRAASLLAALESAP